jgi:hypothetical protein
MDEARALVLELLGLEGKDTKLFPSGKFRVFNGSL